MGRHGARRAGRARVMVNNANRVNRLRQLLGAAAWRPSDWKTAARYGIVDTNAARWFWPGTTAAGLWRFGVEDFAPIAWTDGRAKNPDRFQEFVDAVTFDPERPERWSLALGLVDWLGESSLYLRRFDSAGEPLRLCATPLAWFRAVSRGDRPVCWVGRSALNARQWFRDCGTGPTLVCDDVNHAAAVYKALRAPLPPPPPPRVVFAKPAGGFGVAT
jgi:hypothetical protein